MKVTDECIACGTCADACDAGAISESDDLYRITEECTGCRTCMDVCPVDAIVE